MPDQVIQITRGTSLVLAILLDIALFWVLYNVLPHGDSTWRKLLPGAIGAGLLWELAKKAFLLFISTYISTSNLVYGSVAAILAFLTWAYLSGYIFLIDPHLNVTYYQRKLQLHKAVVQYNQIIPSLCKVLIDILQVAFGTKRAIRYYD